ncbi:hypothetical protein, partial [Streptomyces sp. NPDC002403]
MEDLGGHGLAGDELGELPPDASEGPGGTGPEETMNPADPNQTHHPASPPLIVEDLTRTIRQLAAQHGRRAGVGVHLADLAAHLGRTQDEIRSTLTANGINVKKLDLQFDGERRNLLGVRVDDLGGHGLAHLPRIEDLARTIRELASADNNSGVHLADLTTHLRGLPEFEHLDLQGDEIRGVLEAAGISVRQFTLRFGGERRDRLGVQVDDLDRHGLAHLPTIEDLARTIRQLAGERTGVHLSTLTTHFRLQEYEIRHVLEPASINVQQLKLPVGDKQRHRLGVRVDDLGGHGLARDESSELLPDASEGPGGTGREETTGPAGPGRAHHPASPPLAIEDLARTIRELAGERAGVYLATLTTHLRRTEAEIRSTLKANGITVKTLRLRFDGKQSKRLGVRVDDLGGHGLAHLPTIEDLARTIRELAGKRTGVHLDALAAHLHLKEFQIRAALEAAGITVQGLALRFGDERRQLLGVRVDDLGGRGLAQLPTVEDLARTIRELAAQRKRTGVHLADLAAHLHLREDEVRGVLEAASVSVKKLDLWFGGERRFWLGVRVDALGGRGLVGGGSGGLSR